MTGTSMTSPASHTEPWPTLEVCARNLIDDPRKKMHDPQVAQRLGFAGGLVPGTVLYAYMLRPLVARFGRSWMERGTCGLDLFKPVYDGDNLTIHVMPRVGASGALTVEARDGAGQVMARLEADDPQPPPKVNPLFEMDPGPVPAREEPLHWDLLELNRPFATLHWTPGMEEQAAFCAEAEECLPLFLSETPVAVHPGLIVRQANNTLVHQYRAEFGIHTASRIVKHAPLHVGQPVEVRAMPLDKWEKRGHQYVRLYVAMVAHGIPAVELDHTLIFRPRGA
jgi:hypothetical protein